MRSELVFGATARESNRYLLTCVASKATRMLHRPDTRLEDTSNAVLRFCGHANPTCLIASSGGTTNPRKTQTRPY
jgi:hypothetical protein